MGNHDPYSDPEEAKDRQPGVELEVWLRRQRVKAVQ